ncbi:MAG TPA: DNA topoisomerase 4 subunit A [Firmicutes bacterium]|nr:DNA topoisomerase 4 subunit A [Bacillota bacterium]
MAENENIAQEHIITKSMEDVMHESMLPYSEYVILDRALPRVEDGLKPVQRRILYTMHELGIRHDTPYRKCARIVGDCLGKYHPHGDTSVYGALVRLAQPFNMNAPLVDGQGNFGSVDGDGAAAMRYTEARLTALSLELLRDLDKDTVRWSCNFDDTLKEPDMLPGRFPNLLVNGASGIAVGLATNIPPHNLAETIDGVCAYIDNPRISLKEMMKIIKGPDFPTGGYVIGGEELVKAYETGKGKVTLRAKLHVEADDNDKKLIVIDELPYQVNKSALLESILKLKEDKKGALMFIQDITDESDRNGMRAVIKVKKDGDVGAILDMLYKGTNISTSFGINMVAIANGKPQQMGLLDIIAYYTDYQRDVIVRRTRFELEAAKKREHILEGLVIAVENIDEVVRIIKNSTSTSDARDRLRKRFDLSEVQAQAILDLRLARLTHLEVFKLEQELREVRALVSKLQAILGSKKLQMETVKTEMQQIKKTFKEGRKTGVLGDLKQFDVPDMSQAKPVEETVVTVNALGHLKKMPVKSFNMATRDFTDNSTKKEICSSVVKTDTDHRLYCFTNKGNCYKVDVDSVPDGKWRDNGAPLSKVFAGAEADERVLYVLPIEDALPKGSMLFYTRMGMIKKSDWKELAVVKSAFQVCKVVSGDEIIGVEQYEQGSTLMFVTEKGMCLNADMSDIPLQGRIAAGVKGIQLSEGDRCVMIKQVTPEGEIAIITNRGFGKRVICADIDVMGRYRKGVKIIDFGKTRPSNGDRIVFASYVKEPYKVVLEEEDNYLVAFSTEDISIENRTHAGRQLFKGKLDIIAAYIYNDGFTPGG